MRKINLVLSFIALLPVWLLFTPVSVPAAAAAFPGQRIPEGDVMFHNTDRTVLMNAAYHCDTQGVRRFLQGGANVNAKRAANGLTALHYAIRGGCYGTMQALIDGGADLNALNANGDTLLYYAVDQRNPEAVQTLLNNGVDPNAKSGERRPLFYAVILGKERMTEVLLQGGADPNLGDDGVSPLVTAIFVGQLAMVRSMVERHGGDVKRSLPDGNSMLDLTEPGSEMEKLLASYGVARKKSAPVQHKPVTPDKKAEPGPNLVEQRRRQLKAGGKPNASELYRQQEAADPRLREAAQKKARDERKKRELAELEEQRRQEQLRERQRQEQQQPQAPRQEERQPKGFVVEWSDAFLKALDSFLRSAGAGGSKMTKRYNQVFRDQQSAKTFIRQAYREAAANWPVPSNINENNMAFLVPVY